MGYLPVSVGQRVGLGDLCKFFCGILFYFKSSKPGSDRNFHIYMEANEGSRRERSKKRTSFRFRAVYVHFLTTSYNPPLRW